MNGRHSGRLGHRIALAARESYHDPKTGTRIKSGAKLGDKYQTKNVPVVRQRLCQAGLRLAKGLSEALSAQ